ncbi:MAG: hypothetical protein NVSMB14_07830 [Isosphaeraceae bacterium]
MTPYDATIIGVVIAGMVWGAFRGLAWQAASIASLILGYAAAHGFSQQLAPHLPGEPLLAKALAMIILYAAVSGAIHLAAWSARATLRKMKFEAYDRHLGMVLGGVEGAFLAVIGTIFVVGLFPTTRDSILKSPSGQGVSAALETCQTVLPNEYRQMLTKYWNGGGSSVPSNETVSQPAAPAADSSEAKIETMAKDGSAATPSANVEDEIRGGIKDVLKREGSRLEREARNEIENRIDRLGSKYEQSDTTPRR